MLKRLGVAIASHMLKYKTPFSLSSISALIQTKPDISERKKPVTSKKPLQATTHCIWKRAQRWLNISKLNVPTTESVNVRPLIFLHRGDHKTLLIRDGFRSKWNFIKEWLERLSHKPGQLGASLLNLKNSWNYEWSQCTPPHRGSNHEPSVLACVLKLHRGNGVDQGPVAPAVKVTNFA